MWKPFTIVGDNHGDQQDDNAVAAFQKFNKDWKPKIRIHLGDVFDFRPIRLKATELEKAEFMRKDFDAGLEFLNQFAPTHFLRGNHDERLWDLSRANRGLLSEYATSLIDEVVAHLNLHKTHMLPYDKREGVLQLGKLKVIHGYTHGINAARRSAATYGSVFMGHIHSAQSASIEGLDYRVGRSIACLCKLNMPYSRATMASLVHSHGWAYGVFNEKTGEYAAWQAESINGLWVYPTNIKINKGKDRSLVTL
jgi:predicted phosphodiesterase